MVMQQTPRDFQALGSIAAIDPSRNNGKLGAANGAWAKIPAYYNDVQQRALPLTQAEFDAAFGGSIPLFDSTGSTPGRQTNAETGDGVNEPFLAMGVGIVAIGEGKAFTLPGALMDINRSGSPATIPQVDGCEGDEGGGESGDERSAALAWGYPTWNLITALFQRYRLQLAVNRRFLLVDEALNDVGMVPVPPEFVGASDSLVSAMPYVRQVNDVLASKTDFAGKVFLPQNIAGTVCVGAPTAAVTYGHPKIPGLSNRIFCFNQPIPILPGMRFDTKFIPVENDLAVGGYLDNMNREVVLDPATPTFPDAAYTTDTITNTGLTAGIFTVPGGSVSLGLVLKGYAMQPRCCVEYVTQYMTQGSAMQNMVYGQAHQYLGMLLNRKDLFGNDQGLLGRLAQGLNKLA